MKDNQKSNYKIAEIMEMLNIFDSAVEGPIQYFSLTDKSIVSMNKDIEDEGYVRLPSMDDLAPFNEVKALYCDDRNLDIPHDMSVMQFIRENGYDIDFREYQRQIVEQKLDQWCREIGILIA